MVKFRWKLLSFAFPILSQANNNKYSDYNKSRFPSWVTASVTEDANCDPKHLSAADKFCMPNKNSWEHQYPIVFSEIEKDNIKNAMKTLYGNPQGRQRVETVLNGQNTLSQDVWDFAQNIFYRDGDLFVVPNAGQYQRLMKFNSDGNAHTEFVQQQQSNEFNDNFQQEQIQTDEHMNYAKDFCHFLTGSELVQGKTDQSVNEYYAKAPSNGLAESVMYTPHSQAEFKMLFENEDYKTFNDQTILRGNEFQGKSLCELQNPDGSSNSKFWTGLYREGKNFRVRSNANNPLYQINLKTDDPWFSTDFRDPAKNVCSRKIDGDFMYAQMETRKDVNGIAVGCPDGISNDDSNNDDPSRDGEKCWQNERHPLKYQNFKNQHIKSLNNLDSGTNTRQRDCIIVQCERNNKEAFFYRDICSQINFVPVCRVPLLSCAKTNTCDKQTYTSLQANPKNQNTFCGKTRIVKETNDFVSQSIPSQITRALSRMNANFVFEETTSNVNAINKYAVPWVFQPKRELLVSNSVITRFTRGTPPYDMFDPDVMTANGLNAGDVREATSQDKECPCECGCIETHPDDFDQSNPITDSDIHFHRVPFVNKVASVWPQSTWTNQNRQDYIRFQYDKDYTSNVNSDWIYGNQIGQENAFKCHANLVSATNQLGNPTDFFQENKFTSGSMEYIRTECKEKIYCSKRSLNDGNACDGNTDFSTNDFRITSTHARHFYEKPDVNAVGEVESDSVPVTTGTVRSAILENDSGVFQLQTCPQRHNEMCRQLVCGTCTKPKAEGQGCDPRLCQLPQLTDRNAGLYRTSTSLTKININTARFTCSDRLYIKCDPEYVMYDTNDNYIQSQSFRYICDQKQNDENPLFCEENNANNCPRIVDNIKCVKQCVQPTGTNILTPIDWQGPDGTRTTIFCQAGYHIKDNPTQTSQTITCTNLRYPNVDCIPEKCSDPKLLTLENGYCYADEGVTNFVDDQRAICRCNKCFAMVNNRDSQHPVPLDQSLNCHVQYNEITCSNNEWLRLNDVKCEPLICGNPPQLENADLVFETNVITGQTEQRTFFTNATCGQKVYYECMPGYRAFFQNSDTETRPYAVCKADGSGCFDKIVGSCVPITCPRIEVPEANSWMPIYLGSDIERYHDYRTLNTEKVRNFQRGQDFAIGTQAVYECYEDFSAKPDCQRDCQSFFNKTVNIARDIAAANPSAAHSDQDSLLITESNSVVRVLRDPSQNLPNKDPEERFKTCCRSEETDTTQEMLDREDGILDRFPGQIACHNSKVRRECMPDGRWSEPSHTCMCEKPAEVKMTECERFRWWRLENRMNFPTPPQYTWPINTPGGNTNTGSTSANNNFGTSTGGTTSSQANSNNANRNTGNNSNQQGNGNFNQQTGTTSSSGILIASSALVPLAFVGN